MSDSQFNRLIRERRKRLVASILGHAEREFYAQLDPEQRAAFREKVIDSIDSFSDLMRDIVSVQGEDAIVNAHVVQLIEEIHRATQDD